MFQNGKYKRNLYVGERIIARAKVRSSTPTTVLEDLIPTTVKATILTGSIKCPQHLVQLQV